MMWISNCSVIVNALVAILRGKVTRISGYRRPTLTLLFMAVGLPGSRTDLGGLGDADRGDNRTDPP